jgi:hypothetical protein
LLTRNQEDPLNIRAVKDCVPDFHKIQVDRIKDELKTLQHKSISIIFDATPHIAEVFGACFCFVDNKHNITFRAVELKFYNESFNRNKLQLAFIEVIRNNDVEYENVKFAVCDGCYTNLACLNKVCMTMTDLTEVICMSHSANCIGKILSSCEFLKKAFLFEEKWSAMMSRSNRAKSIFKNLAGLTKSPKTSNAQRWYYFYEIIKEIYEHSAAVKQTIEHEEDFCEELRKPMKEMIKYELNEDGTIAVNEVAELRWQLAVIIDVGKYLVQLCYSSEQDGELRCAKTYDHWQKVSDFLRNACRLQNRDTANISRLLPSVHANALALSGNDTHDQEYKRIVDNAVQSIMPVFEKFSEYNDKDRERTLRIFRACRFFNYTYIANQTLDDLEAEMVHLNNIAYFCKPDIFQKLKSELRKYRESAIAAYDRAQTDVEEENLWQFWKNNKALLPNFFGGACEVAIIPSSSATVERLFSYLSSGFDDSQEHLLADIKKASTMLRYNENMREKQK